MSATKQRVNAVTPTTSQHYSSNSLPNAAGRSLERRFRLDFMTRNNLGDHLAWLLRSIDLSTPIGPELPNATDPIFSPDTLFPVSSQDAVAGTGSSIVPSLDPEPSPADLEVALITDAEAGSGSGSQDIAGNLRRAGTMAKLTSSTKSKKPGLVVAQKQLPKVASSPSLGRLQKAYSASLYNEDLLAKQKDIRSTPANSSKPRKRQILTSALDISDSEDDGLEALDLTADDHADSSSIVFGDSDFLDADDFVSTSDPTSQRGKKRKSDEITKKLQKEDNEDEDEFPDIFDIVPEQKTPASVRRPRPNLKRPQSVKASRKISQSPALEQRTVTQTISTTQTRVLAANEVGNHMIPFGDLPRSSSDRTISQRGSTPRRSKLNTRSSSPVSDRQAQQSSPAAKRSAKARRSDIIQDSDDEFVTPPTHHVSFATCASDSEMKDVAQSESPTFMANMGQPSSAEGSFLIETPSKRESTTFEAQNSLSKKETQNTDDTMNFDQLDDSARRAEPGEDSSSTAEPSDSTLLVDHFLGNPTVVEARRQTLKEKLQDNVKRYGRAIATGMSPAARERIRNEKPPLVARLKALDALLEAHKAHETLETERKQILQAIESAYCEDLDTTEDEARVEVLNTTIDNQRMILARELKAAGIEAALFEEANTFADNLHQHPSVVLATQAPSRNTSSSMNGSTLIPECNSQVILQTQVPVTESRGTTVYQQFPTPALQASRKPTAPQYEADDEFFMDDEDFFQELENTSTRHHNDFPARSKSHAAQGSHSKSSAPRTETFSDYDDGMDFHNMLALAEDFDRHQGVSHPVMSRRSPTVFTETSGNAFITPRATSASRKDTSSASKALIPRESTNFPWSADVRRALKDRFRMSGFRHNQLEAINATLEGKDAFVLMPTGGGKSLCYQLPAVISSGKTRGVTIVISPLLSLMQDQVDHLNALNIIAKPFNGEMKKEAKDMILGAFKEKNPEHFVQLLYVTPEMVSKSHAFCNALLSLHRNKKLARIVIDEAHCVSQWGHDFRPDYKALGEFRQKFPSVPVMALTATATQNVIADTKHNLAMDGCQVFSQSFNRDNLYYEIRAKNKSTVPDIADLINSRYQNQTGIVYTLSKKSAELIAQKLKENHGIAAHHYHAGMEPPDKAKIQRSWQKGLIKVVVATIAFGMGIDKPDVRFVIHYYLPKSLEGYYQETGRAGRDGNPSDCYLYFQYGDVASLRAFIDKGEGSYQQKERQREMLDRMINYCKNKHECRREQILRYFGEIFSREQCNKACDNCRVGGEFQLQDFTECAKAALEVIRLYSHMTLAQCTDILMGKKKPEYDDAMQYYGIAKRMKKSDVNSMIFKLAAEHALIEKNTIDKRFGGAIAHYAIGSAAREYMSGRRKLGIMAEVCGAKAVAPKQSKKRTKRTQAEAAEAAEVLDAPHGRRPPPSTNVSSPIRKRKKARVAHFIDDEATDDGGEDLDSAEDISGPMHVNGYEKDNFVVSDEDEDEHLNPVRYAPRQRQRTLDELGPPISRDTTLAEANISDLHQDIIGQFMSEAKELEEKVRNAKGLRRILFTEQHLRQMAIRWTTSLDMMQQIPGINNDNVDRYGSKFLLLVKQYQENYKEITGGAGEHDGFESALRSPPARRVPGPVRPEVVELLSSDEEGPDEEDEDDDDLGSSRYFGQGASGGGGPSKEVEKWNEKFERLSQGPASKKGKRPASRKASGHRGNFARGRFGGGVSKRKASAGGSRRTSSGSSKSKASKGGAGRVASSGIGLMPL